MDSSWLQSQGISYLFCICYHFRQVLQSMSITEKYEMTKLNQRLDQKLLQIAFKSVGPDEFHRWIIVPASYLTREALGVTLPSFWDVTEP